MSLVLPLLKCLASRYHCTELVSFTGLPVFMAV